MQQAALKAISESLVEDPLVQAVFVKGSIARGEEDEFSDIDLYCLVKEEDKGDFLNKRIGHLEKSALGNKIGMWLGPGHGDMCHVGRAEITSRWGFATSKSNLGQRRQGPRGVDDL